MGFNMASFIYMKINFGGSFQMGLAGLCSIMLIN